MTAQASAIHPPQRDAVVVALVLLDGLGKNFLPLQWLGLLVVVVAQFQFENHSRSPA